MTATSSARDADLVRELGADEVIDYRTQRFEDVVADLDLVFDTVGGETWERSWDVLRPGGRLVSIAVPRPPEREAVDGRRAIWFVVELDREQLREIGRLIDAGGCAPSCRTSFRSNEGSKRTDRAADVAGRARSSCSWRASPESDVEASLARDRQTAAAR